MISALITLPFLLEPRGKNASVGGAEGPEPYPPQPFAGLCRRR